MRFFTRIFTVRFWQYLAEEYLGYYTPAAKRASTDARAFFEARAAITRRSVAARVQGYRCATCGGPITAYSDENDYICDPCGGFVNVVQEGYGLISGDGRGSSDRPRRIGMVQ